MPSSRQNFFRIANLLWWLGLPCIILLDYVLRRLSDNYFALGLGEQVWFAAHALLAIASIVLLGLFLRDSPKRVAVVKTAIALFFGGLYYFIAVFGYILGTGLDSF